MVGNDIIDLNETRISTNWERPGFMKKVFTPTEQVLIHASRDPFMAVWQLWSMKESVYKVFMQAGGKRFYNPTKLACQLIDSTNGEVRIGDLILKTTTLFHADYLFTTAVVNDSKAQSHIFELEESNQSFQSNFMHQQVINDFAKRNTLQSEQLTIQKNTDGVPFIQDKNGRVNTSLSITHHGNYGAYSVVVN